MSTSPLGPESPYLSKESKESESVKESKSPTLSELSKESELAQEPKGRQGAQIT